jgi:hypothetical protein
MGDTVQRQIAPPIAVLRQIGNVMPVPQRWARCPPHLVWTRPGLPTSWVRVLERHAEESKALPGYVWLDMPGKVGSIASTNWSSETTSG